MLTFTVAIFFLLITPGPGVLSTAGVGSAFGFRSGIRYVTGLCLGTNLVALIVISGLATFIFEITWARFALLILSSGYLTYLAVRIAMAGRNIAFIKAQKHPDIRSGVLLQLINPKAYAFNTTLFSGFSIYPQSPVTEIAIKFFVVNLIWIPIHLLWLYAGTVVHQMNLKPATQQRINIFMAVSMVIVVALAFWSIR